MRNWKKICPFSAAITESTFGNFDHDSRYGDIDACTHVYVMYIHALWVRNLLFNFRWSATIIALIILSKLIDKLWKTNALILSEKLSRLDIVSVFPFMLQYYILAETSFFSYLGWFIFNLSGINYWDRFAIFSVCTDETL